MKVTDIYNIHRNDCHMDVECEYCGNQETYKNAYNDAYYINNVVPSKFCSNCLKNAAGNTKPEKQSLINHS